jgi:small subunit ribosomal protein S24e
MEFTITKKVENTLLSRVEVEGELAFEGATPSNADVAAALCKNLSCETNLVVIKQISGVFSHQKASFRAVVYQNMEAKMKFEMNTKHLKKKAEEAKAKEVETAAQAEEKKEEVAKEEPAVEDKKEEVKEETNVEEKLEEPAQEGKPIEESKEEPAAQEKKEEGEA